MSKAHEWLESLTHDSQNEAARRAGISERTFYNQLGKGAFSVENVLLLAEAYEVHPVRALMDTGWVDQRWEGVEDVVAALRLASPQQLSDEMLRRIEEAEARADGKPEEFTTPIDELAARRSNQNAPAVQPLSDDELAEAIREANARPRAAHPATETEYTEPEAP